MPDGNAVSAIPASKWSASRVLKQRLLTAAVLIAGIAYAVLALETRWLAVILAVIAVLGAYEWSLLMNLKTVPVRLLYAAGIAALLWLCWIGVLHDPAALGFFITVSGAWWLLATLWLSQPQLGADDTSVAVLMKACAGVFTLVPSWVALLTLHAQVQHGIHRLLFLLTLIWVADTAAYFTGKRWGRAKLAPRISPGKTRVGVYGALTAVAVYGFFAATALGVPAPSRVAFAALCIVTGLFSVVGDLFESLFKRQRGVKDSGTLIPGHGGVLDRIDSLTAAAPIFVLGLHWLDL
jgi:phosphatidate cytidylyltransferase